MKKINICSCNNSFWISLHISYITKTRHLQLLIEEYSLLWGLSAIYIWNRSFTLRQFTWINGFVHRKTSWPILFLLCVFSADFKDISAIVSLVYMQSSGRFDVWQNFMYIRVEKHCLILKKILCYYEFYQKRRILTFYCLNFDSHRHLWMPVTTDNQYLRGTCDSLPGVLWLY